MKRPLIFDFASQQFPLLSMLSDPCFLWRRRLNRRAEGTLLRRHWAALEAHLARCASCRAAGEADRTLWESMGAHSSLLDQDCASAFDDRVVSALNDPATLPACRPSLAARLAGFAPFAPFLTDPNRSLASGLIFLTQLASGAATAAAITGLCLMPALHPLPSPTTHAHFNVDQTAASPPVSLEMLLNTTAPRAALLWSAPRRSPATLLHQELLPLAAPRHTQMHPRRDNRPRLPIG